MPESASWVGCSGIMSVESVKGPTLALPDVRGAGSDRERQETQPPLSRREAAPTCLKP
jgi:hypothetical protein